MENVISLNENIKNLCMKGPGANFGDVMVVGGGISGIQASLVDMACALALSTAFDGAMPFYTSDLHLRYLEPADGDLEAEARVVRRSARSGILECRLRVGETVVALGTCHFTIKPKLMA